MTWKLGIDWCAEGDQSPVILPLRAAKKLNAFLGRLRSVFKALTEGYQALPSATENKQNNINIAKKSSTTGSTRPARGVF